MTDKKAAAPSSTKPPEEGKGCCCCCAGDPNPVPAHLRNGTESFFNERSCTDICMVIVYLLFLAGWIVVIAVALANGDPVRILLPSNYRDELCGDSGSELASFNSYFAPLPSRPKYGYCTQKCPAVGDVVCNNDKEPEIGNAGNLVRNHRYSTTRDAFFAAQVTSLKCQVPSACTASEKEISDTYAILRLKMQQKKCFVVFYPTKPSLQRCLPSISAASTGAGQTPNMTLMAAANETQAGLDKLKDALGASSFFTLGFAEIKQAWLVILVSAFTCMAIAGVWVMLLKWILAPIVYTVIVLVLALFIIIGFICNWLATDLETTVLPGETGTENQVTIWRALAYISWLCAAIYLVVMIFLLKRVRIALTIMEEATNAFIASPSMVLIPFATFFVLIGWVAFFVVTTIYIQTMGTFDAETIQTAAQSYAGDSVNVSALLEKSAKFINVSSAGEQAAQLNVSRYTVEDRTKILHAYNIFMILWTGNFCMMFGFMVLVFIVCAWYFSATKSDIALYEGSADVPESSGAEGEEPKKRPGKLKGTNAGVMCTSMRATFCNHLGTVLWGSLLIAIIQFIRALFLYLKEQYLDEWKDSATGAIATYCVDYCLRYIENVVKTVSKNAFIICVIKNTGFCTSALDALTVLADNALVFSILAFLSNATLFLVKIFIVGCNMCAAYGLLFAPALTEDKPVDSGLFPLFLIFLMSFAIAALFMDVYEACIDTVFVCFCVDKEFNYEFTPDTLTNLVGAYSGAEKARQEYEASIKKAQAQVEAGKKH